jgi:hypothetical protein
LAEHSQSFLLQHVRVACNGISRSRNAFARKCPEADLTISGEHPRVLILSLHHGATHERLSRALEKALLQLRPNLKVEVVDTLAHCTPWFRAYYNSYEIPLKYWPGLWDYIESHQFEGKTSGPWWLYRRGARPLFRYIEAFAPDVVVATEVGLAEIAVIHKREFGARYSLVGAQTQRLCRVAIGPRCARAWAFGMIFLCSSSISGGRERARLGKL